MPNLPLNCRPRFSLLAMCLAMVACQPAADPPEVRRDVPGFLFCGVDGDSPLSGRLVGRPLDEIGPYTDAAMAAGVVVDVAGIEPDGTASLILIETTDILTVLHRNGVIESISCLPRDLCTGPRRSESALCARAQSR